MKFPNFDSDSENATLYHFYQSALTIALITRPDIKDSWLKHIRSYIGGDGLIHEGEDYYNAVREWIRAIYPQRHKIIAFELRDTSLSIVTDLLHPKVKSYLLDVFPRREGSMQRDYRLLWTRLHCEQFTEPDQMGRAKPVPPYLLVEALRNEELRVDFQYNHIDDLRYSYSAWAASPKSIDDSDAINRGVLDPVDGAKEKQRHVLAGPIFDMVLTQARSNVVHIIMTEWIGLNRHGEPNSLWGKIRNLWGDGVVIRHDESEQTTSEPIRKDDSMPLLGGRARPEDWYAWFDWYYRQGWGAVPSRMEHMAQLNGKSQSQNEKMHSLYMADKRN